MGIYFGHGKKECEKLNWEKKIMDMKNTFCCWEKRNLSILGKILIVKTLIIPKFTFLASATVVPISYIKEIESCCFNYIWKGKRDKVKRSTLIAQYEEGGLNMIDVECYFKSLKASWVPRLIKEKTANWKIIPYKYFSKFGKNLLIFSMNIDSCESLYNLNTIPEFYRQIIHAWIEVGGGQTKKLKILMILENKSYGEINI